MEQEDGNISSARGILQRALRLEPGNAHLMQGLGQLELQAGNDATAKNYFRQAIKENPSFANPYHALGTLEHTQGNIKAALKVIKVGLKKCPKNHRLHHALGDVYLDANMLDLAEESYLEGLQHGPEWSKSFFYTSLSFVAYAKGHAQESRTLLRQSLDINGGMHAQGVIALAQLEESGGNIQAAREVYRDAILRYEKRRRKRSPFRSKSPIEEVLDSSSLVDENGNQYSMSYSGDKWVNVFNSWARMEEIYGTYETAHIVFSKAARLFPNNVSLLIQWADLQSDHGEDEKARLLYEAACQRAVDGSSKPYQALAEFEMKRKNFVKAQSILIRGAQSAASSNGIADGKSGSARLLHTWGVCEYRLGNESRAQHLLEDALRVTGPGEADSAMRSLILYSMARLELSRGEHLLAQHCIGLSLKENLFPGGNSLIWKLWAEIALKMDNKDLEKRCNEQALLRWEEERGGTVSDLSRLLGTRGSESSSRLPERTGSVMKDKFRKTPWYSKVCQPSGRMDKSWYRGANLWKL
jgi:tetratricopeptide (TPR) repeat protein